MVASCVPALAALIKVPAQCAAALFEALVRPQGSAHRRSLSVRGLLSVQGSVGALWFSMQYLFRVAPSRSRVRGLFRVWRLVQ